MMTPAQIALAEALTSPRLSPELIRTRTDRIHQRMLSLSPQLRTSNFTRIGNTDLQLMFEAYDRTFFDGLLERTLNGIPLHFRLSTRMTKTGGTTTRFRSPSGLVYYEISIACSLLFDAFREGDRKITVCGLDSNSRLEALQRIFEHELIHLAEQLCWTSSDCCAARFQAIAAAYFLHKAHTHRLVTRHERAAGAGVRIGSTVRFSFEGTLLSGRVNRITKRATVLVEDAGGIPYSDGKRYLTYYVPIERVEVVSELAR